VKLFIDTNVLLDVIAKRVQFLPDSSAIWSLAESGKVTGLIASISVTNIYYIVRRLADHRTAIKAMVELRGIFTFVACDGQVISQAIDARMPDFEDSVQYFSALHAGADVLVTRNPKHFPRSVVPVVTPTEYLATRAQP
jgi:predicted nucleic acid-binding protein